MGTVPLLLLLHSAQLADKGVNLWSRFQRAPGRRVRALVFRMLLVPHWPDVAWSSLLSLDLAARYL